MVNTNIIIMWYLIVHYHTLYNVTYCTLSWGGAWVNYGKLATKLGRFYNQLPPCPSSTPHFKSLAESFLFGMISSLVFWIELSESPNLVPDSSMKPENGREMDWKGNEKTPQVELKPPRDDEKWWFCRQRLVNVFFVPVTSKILWECILFLQQPLKSLENLSWKQNVRILLEYFLNWSFPDRNGSLGASSLLLLPANPIVGGVWSE